MGLMGYMGQERESREYTTLLTITTALEGFDHLFIVLRLHELVLAGITLTLVDWQCVTALTWDRMAWVEWQYLHGCHICISM